MSNEENNPVIAFSSMVLAVFVVVALIHLAKAFTPVPMDLSWSPITLAIELATGDPWPAAASWLLGAEAVVIIAAFAWWSTRPVSRNAEESRRLRPRG